MKMREFTPIFIIFSVIIFSSLNLFAPVGFLSQPVATAIIEKPDIKPSLPSEVKKIQSQDEKQTQAVDAYKKAMELSKTREYDKAIEEFKKALELDPNFAEAHLNLGWSYAMKRSNYDIALQETLEAIKLKPDMPIAYRNLWWIYRLLSTYDKALSTLEKLVELEPDNVVNFINLGDGYVSDKLDIALAVKAYKRGLEIDPKNLFIHRKLAKAYEYQKKYDLAEDEFKKAIELNPTDAYSYLFLSVTLGKAGKESEIQPLVKKAYDNIAQTIPVANRFDMTLLKFYANEVTEEELLEKGKMFPIHNCQALYYAGVRHIWQGNEKKGKMLLEESESLKVEGLSEYEYSKTELKFLKAKKDK